MMNKKSRFQYVPVSGPIPGKDFEKQTEAAINEITGVSLEAGNKANQAIETASNALNVANDALETANTAQTTANNAINKADGAVNTANRAMEKSETAMDRANQAFDKAVNAESKAENSDASAAGAVETANTAISTAKEADEKAEQAKSLAEGTSETLETSLYYQHPVTTYEPFVIDNETNSRKFYITDLTLLNLPAQERGFLTIRSEREEEDAASYSVYQNYHTLSGREYSRAGMVTVEPDGSETVTWAAWVEIALTTSDITGSAATATALRTARKIGEATFDGTSDITLTQMNAIGYNPIPLGPTTDWNTITTPGYYGISQEGGTFSAAYNHPVGAYSYGVLVVLASSVSRHGIAQTYYSHGASQIWHRGGFSASGWQPWRCLFIDGKATSAKALQIVASNEIRFDPQPDGADLTNRKVLFNYRWADLSTTKIDGYKFCNGDAQGTTASIEAREFIGKIDAKNIVGLTKSFQELHSQSLGGFKNYIINGNFDVWQRGTEFTDTKVANSAKFLADRYYFRTNHRGNSSANATVSKVKANLTGSNYALRTEITGAEATTGENTIFVAQLLQLVEIPHVAKRSKFTLSFYVRGKSVGNINTAILTTTGSSLQNETRSINILAVEATEGKKGERTGDYCYKLTEGWSKVVVKFETLEESTENKFLEVGLARLETAGENTNATIGDWYEVAQVQLEAGEIATEFEQRPTEIELMLCQRYFEKIDMYMYTATAFHRSNIKSYYYGSAVRFSKKRTIPTLSFKPCSPSSPIPGVSLSVTPGSGGQYKAEMLVQHITVDGATLCVKSLDAVNEQVLYVYTNGAGIPDLKGVECICADAEIY